MITIDYLESSQKCSILSNDANDAWKSIQFQYSQVTDDAESYQESIKVPWHTFLANLNILSFVINHYDIKVEFTELAKNRLQRSLDLAQGLTLIGNDKPLVEEELVASLNKSGFQRRLTKEQLRNVLLLSRLPIGATFSVPGAGKTTEAISFYLLHKKADDTLLVICPKNAFPAWEEQFQICLKEKSPTIKRLVDGSNNIEILLRDAINSVFLITYQQYVRVVSIVAKFLNRRPTFLFIDESHRMKGGSKTDTGRQIQRIAHLPIGKLIMSGTPMPNSILDLIPQYNFLFPTDGEVSDSTVIEKFRKIYVRTTKDELGLRKPKIIITKIPLNEPTQRLYNLVKSEELRQIAGSSKIDNRQYRQLGKSYMRLLQIVSNPSLLLKTTDIFPQALREAVEFGNSSKIEYVIMKVRQLAKKGHKVLVWSSFVENIESLTQTLSDLGARCIHGGVDAGNEDEENSRERIVKDFHDDKNMFVLIANPAACSEGISLHRICHHAIYLDRNYNAAQFLQSMDRIHRLGLGEGIETIIEVVNAPNTIDDLVNDRLNEKISRMAKVLEDHSLHIEPVSVELDEDGFDMGDADLLLKHLRGL